MEIIPSIYIAVLPILLIFSLLYLHFNKYCINVLSTINLLVWMYAIYSFKILIGILQLFRSINEQISVNTSMQFLSDEFVVKQISKIVVPFFLLIPKCRNSFLFSLLILLNLCWTSSMHIFDWQNVFLSILYCFSLFCATYALLWLLKQHPSQKVNYNV